MIDLIQIIQSDKNVVNWKTKIIFGLFKSLKKHCTLIWNVGQIHVQYQRVSLRSVLHNLQQIDRKRFSLYRSASLMS